METAKWKQTEVSHKLDTDGRIPVGKWPVGDVQSENELIGYHIPLHPGIAFDLCEEFIQSTRPLWLFVCRGDF